jgi:exonuclease III
VNCNSVNLTSSSESYDSKLNAICTLTHDIILLCDLRLGEINNQRADHKLKTSLLKSNLKFHTPHIHSTQNKRGVAILIKNSLNISVINDFRDQDENILILKCTRNGKEFAIGSVYGPNNTNRDFYNILRRFLNRNDGVPLVLGGDWNTTWDGSDPVNNIDIHNMARPPNTANGKLLRSLSEDFNLTDPFRVLHPTMQKFSYSPFGGVRKNRSRLDFFIVSSDLLTDITDCDIHSAHLSGMFDHKPIFLKLNQNPSMRNLSNDRTLKNWFLDEPVIKMSAELAALQVYSRAINPQQNDETVNLLRVKINILTANIISYTQLLEKVALNVENNNEYLDLMLAAKCGEHEATLNELPNWDSLSDMPKTCTDGEFFIALTDRISEKVSKIQNKLNRYKNIKKSQLEKILIPLYDDYRVNEEKIIQYEKELGAIKNLEMNRLLMEKKIFENLNFERPSKNFLNIAKCMNKPDSLDVITNDDGTEFINKKDREKHITNFYSTLYSKDEGVGGSIEDFLGEDIANHPTVTNSKLTNTEKLNLESDLAFAELENALKESNMKSAPGIDGFSNKFISKFWYILGRPLFKTCTESLNTGTLIDFFATAQIRLIPKKGDTKKIKNWRPISLLSNFYKILSRAINNRLKSVVNRVLSRAQKGFTKARQIQEVIINVSENIKRCELNQIKGAMICVDQSKAFDSVDHGYMEKVFRFFNFGDRFISWLKTIGTGRKACVILSNGEKSNIFDLLRGTAQGDCPSPIIYNFCAQILIFKIELEPSIRKLPIYVANEIIPNPDPHFSNESNMETSKNESFADDSTTFTYCEYEDLLSLKNILEKFSEISGLKCNFEKTVIMRIGNTTDPIDPRIMTLGFDFSDNCKLLGFEFTSNGNCVETNLNILMEKTRRKINFWKVFNLSLSGKITIFKTDILPVLNYYMCVLPIVSPWLRDIELMIENFVASGLTISKEKLYLEPEKGGIGLFKLDDFFCALQCSWLKRAINNSHDNWRYIINNACVGGPIFFQKEDSDTFGPILSGIIKNFIRFREDFGCYENNFLQVPILNNKYFFFNIGREMVSYDSQFFTEYIPTLPENKMRSLCWNNLVQDGIFKSINQVQQTLEVPVTAECFNSLRKGYLRASGTFGTPVGKSQNLPEFLRKKIKGSKLFRKYIVNARNRGSKPKCPIKNFCKIIEVPYPTENAVKIMNKLWYLSYLGSDLKTFLFKMHHNTLGLNYRIHHINPDRDASCTFCVINKTLPAPRESFSHFFWDCVTVEKLIQNFSMFAFNMVLSKAYFFTGEDDTGTFYDTVFLLVSLFKYALWQFKLRKKVPSWPSLRHEFLYLLNIIMGSNKAIRIKILNCNLCRIHRDA